MNLGDAYYSNIARIHCAYHTVTKIKFEFGAVFFSQERLENCERTGRAEVAELFQRLRREAEARQVDMRNNRLVAVSQI